MRHVTRRRLLAYGILALWAGVVAVHIRREYFKPLAARLELGAQSLAPGSEFYQVRMGGQAIGMATSRLDTVPEGFVFDDLLILDVPAMDTLHRAVVHTRVDLSRSLGLRRFAFDLASEVGRFEVRGEAVGDTLLELEVGAGGERQRSAVRLEEGTLLATALPLRLAAGGELEVGRTHRFRIFDPSTLSGREVEVRIAGHDTLIVPDTASFDSIRGEWVVAKYDTLPAWKVEEIFGGVRVSSWVDDDGRLIRAESPLGLTLERTPYEIARVEWDRSRVDLRLASGYGPVIESTAIAADAALDGLDAADSVAVRLAGVELEGFDLEGGRQTLRGDTLVVVREAPARLVAGYRLPYAGGGEAARELGSTPLVQAEDPEIVRVAREIAGAETDPAVVARRLNEWVYRALRKEITLSIPSARQVLDARAGDCNEHTVLYLALARALGLPARTAVGLVRVNDRFYYHAWPEVWLDGWVAVDPTLGQYPADASHLRFLVGGLARQVELIRLIGRLRLERV
jgi:hypothetical protein